MKLCRHSQILVWVISSSVAYAFLFRGLFDHFADRKNEFDNTPEEHKGKLSHELIAGAASYEAMKAYNDHCEKNG
jgi:hypothetical protein